MCPHNRFEILYYVYGIMIRKCLDCGGIDIKTEYWVTLEEMKEAIKDGLK